MATDIGAIVVKIQADVTDIKRGIEDAKKSFSSYGTSSVAVGSLIADAVEKIGKTVLKLGIDSVKAYAEQEAAVTRLSISVGKDAARAFSEYAAQLQKSTTYSDEAIIALQSQLANYGVLPGSINTATKAVVNFAAATGKDLPEAGSAMAQAMSGNARELKRFGLSLDEGATRTQNLAKVTDFLNERFNGAAETMKGTLFGRLESFKNQINELAESIGKLLVPYIDFWAKKLEAVLPILQKFIGWMQLGTSVNEAGVEALKKEREEIIKNAQARAAATEGVMKLTDAEMERMKMIGRQIKELDKVETKEKAVTKQVKLQTGAIEENKNAGIDRINQLKKSATEEQQIHQHITEITQLETQKRIAQSRNSFEAQASFSQALAVKIASDTQSWGMVMAGTVIQIRDTFASGIADMIMNGGNFAQTMESIGRNILQFFIETVIKQMVTQWLISVGIMRTELAALYAGAGAAVPVGLTSSPAAAGGLSSMGGSIGGAIMLNIAGAAAGSYLGGNLFGDKSSQGGANVGAGLGILMGGPLGGVVGGIIGGGVGKSLTKIRKKLFSGGILGEPSLIMGMKSGGMAIAGEDGPEALVSFRDDLGISPAQGRARLTGSSPAGGGGGGGNISINISGQFLEGSPGKWQRMFRTALLPEIRRYTGVSPVGPFIRRRGQS